MSDSIQHLSVLHNNSFRFAYAFSSFFDAIGEKDRAILLGYLVLPMTLHLPSRKFLKNAKITSSMRTMLNEKNRNCIHGLDERLAQYRGITNTTIQYLLRTGGLQLNSQLGFTIDKQHVQDGLSPDGVGRAAHRLGVLFKPFDAPTIYRMLGVMSL